MKKVFISCPMNGLTKEDVDNVMKRLHKIAEIIFGEELDLIQSWIDEEPPEDSTNGRVWYLGKSIELLSTADYFVGFENIDYSRFKGCQFENAISNGYGIESIFLDGKIVEYCIEDAKCCV